MAGTSTGRFNGEDMRQVRKAFGFSIEHMSAFTFISPNSIRRWEEMDSASNRQWGEFVFTMLCWLLARTEPRKIQARLGMSRNVTEFAMRACAFRREIEAEETRKRVVEGGVDTHPKKV